MATLKSLVDETTNIKNELVECRNTLKTNLEIKGISIDEQDNIITLIEKISDISTSKYFSSDFSFNLPAGTTTQTHTRELDIDFIPTIVIITMNLLNYVEVGSNVSCVIFQGETTSVSAYHASKGHISCSCTLTDKTLKINYSSGNNDGYSHVRPKKIYAIKL